MNMCQQAVPCARFLRCRPLPLPARHKQGGTTNLNATAPARLNSATKTSPLEGLAYPFKKVYTPGPGAYEPTVRQERQQFTATALCAHVISSINCMMPTANCHFVIPILTPDTLHTSPEQCTHKGHDICPEWPRWLLLLPCITRLATADVSSMLRIAHSQCVLETLTSWAHQRLAPASRRGRLALSGPTWCVHPPAGTHQGLCTCPARTLHP
jgi:hypothetical protein